MPVADPGGAMGAVAPPLCQVMFSLCSYSYNDDRLASYWLKAH